MEGVLPFLEHRPVLGERVFVAPGAKVIDCDSAICATATVGTGVTVRIGDQTTANRFSGTIDISAGGYFPFTNTLGSEFPTPVAVVGASGAISPSGDCGSKRSSAENLRGVLRKALAELSGKSEKALIDERYEKFRRMGSFFTESAAAARR